MLRSLRNEQGGPALRVRVLAVLVVLGLLLLSAPVLVPVLGWLVDQLI